MKNFAFLKCLRSAVVFGMFVMVANSALAGQACDANPDSAQCANEKYVSSLYLQYLERPAETAGLDYWTDLLNRGVLTREQLVNAIFTSPESCHLRVPKLYRTYLLREPDPSGLAYWVGQCVNGMTTYEMTTAFQNSPEYKSKVSIVHYEFVNKNSAGPAITASIVVQELYQTPQAYATVNVAPGQEQDGQLSLDSLTNAYLVTVGASGVLCSPNLLNVPAVNNRFPADKIVSIVFEPSTGPAAYSCSLSLR